MITPLPKHFVNAYHSNEDAIDELIDKLEGKSQFMGIPDETVWTNISGKLGCSLQCKSK